MGGVGVSGGCSELIHGLVTNRSSSRRVRRLTR